MRVQQAPVRLAGDKIQVHMCAALDALALHISCGVLTSMFAELPLCIAHPAGRYVWHSQRSTGNVQAR